MWLITKQGCSALIDAARTGAASHSLQMALDRGAVGNPDCVAPQLLARFRGGYMAAAALMPKASLQCATLRARRVHMPYHRDMHAARYAAWHLSSFLIPLLPSPLAAAGLSPASAPLRGARDERSPDRSRSAP